MRIIKTSTGSEIELDGDLLSIMEALYHEVTAKRELERSFEDMRYAGVGLPSSFGQTFDASNRRCPGILRAASNCSDLY